MGVNCYHDRNTQKKTLYLLLQNNAAFVAKQCRFHTKTMPDFSIQNALYHPKNCLNKYIKREDALSAQTHPLSDNLYIFLSVSGFLLVFILHHAFMLGRKGTLHSFVSLSHSSLNIVRSFSLRRNRVVYGHHHPMPFNPFPSSR